MSFRVNVRHRAELDITEAQAWYENQRSGLGIEFHTEVSQVFTTLSKTPLLYPILYRDVRRVVIHRFPFLLWYRVHGETVIVLACTHAKQDPNKVKTHLR